MAFVGAFGCSWEVATSSGGRSDKMLEKTWEASAVKSRGGGGVPEVDAPAFSSVACAAAANALTFLSCVEIHFSTSDGWNSPQETTHHP